MDRSSLACWHLDHYRAIKEADICIICLAELNAFFEMTKSLARLLHRYMRLRAPSILDVRVHNIFAMLNKMRSNIIVIIAEDYDAGQSLVEDLAKKCHKPLGIILLADFPKPITEIDTRQMDDVDDILFKYHCGLAYSYLGKVTMNETRLWLLTNTIVTMAQALAKLTTSNPSLRKLRREHRRALINYPAD